MFETINVRFRGDIFWTITEPNRLMMTFSRIWLEKLEQGITQGFNFIHFLSGSLPMRNTHFHEISVFWVLITVTRCSAVRGSRDVRTAGALPPLN